MKLRTTLVFVIVVFLSLVVNLTTRFKADASTAGQPNIMLRVVRVTTDWMPYASVGGWTQAVPLKESDILKFYEVAIWEETSSVHFYEFPNDYQTNPGFINALTGTDDQKIAYREQFLISKYTNMPDAWTDERSAFLKSAFMDIVSYLTDHHSSADHHLMYNGHGGPGGRLFGAQLNTDHTNEFLNFWTRALGKPLGVIDMGGPCNKGSFADLDNFCEYTKYYIASDLPNGGYTMDDWTIDKFRETDPETQYHNLFFRNTTLEETLKGRIDLKRKAYEYSRNNMISNQVAQANYLYSCDAFRRFSHNFKAFLGRVNVDYSIHDDLYQYMIDNDAQVTLIEQFNEVFVHKADNKDFFEWSIVSHGMLMPDPGQISPTIAFNPSVIADQTFTVGEAVSLTLPVATGGTPPYIYNISALPTGLKFNKATRLLSGTPTTATPATLTIYTATDATGASAALNFTITVGSIVATTPPFWIYWRSHQGILRAANDGTNRQLLVNTQTGILGGGIALDVEAGRMYWTDTYRSKIQRANLDGSNIEDVVTGLPEPRGIALDTAGEKMYWTDTYRSKIQRANLDGSNVEDIITVGLNSPYGIALDSAAGKIYWTNYGEDLIQRANLDGSNVEDIVRGLHIPMGIALDVAAGKIYWVDQGRDNRDGGLNIGKIQRANLNGSNLEDLVGGLWAPHGIALDVESGKMYWTDLRSNKIQRANLDGSNVKDLITGINPTGGIALGISQPSSPTPPTVPISFNPSVIANQTFTVGEAVSLTLPVATGGTPPYTYSLSGTLPLGLRFDPLDRWIGGTPITPMPETRFTYTATDATRASASLNFTIEVVEEGADNPLDVNGDGQVTVIDLAIVALFYGTQVPAGTSLPADVNADGTVNLLDLTAVANGIDTAGGNVGGLSLEAAAAALAAVAEQVEALEEAAEAPMGFSTRSDVLSNGNQAYVNVSNAYADARHLAVSDVLSAFLALLAEMGARPETTALLPNYPNPFNPETWIPYHLAQDTEVTLTIYDVRGGVVRTLALGHQVAGVYQSRGRAAYWDGKNQLGEPVASGVYFYTLSTESTRDSVTAGKFTATRKLLIAK